MSTPHRASSVWHYVALAAILAAFFLGIFALIPEEQPEGRTALLGVLVFACTAATTRFLGARVKAVDTKVNGRITQLIDVANEAKADAKAANARADRAEERAVSRETPPTRPPAKKATKKATR